MWAYSRWFKAGNDAIYWVPIIQCKLAYTDCKYFQITRQVNIKILWFTLTVCPIWQLNDCFTGKIWTSSNRNVDIIIGLIITILSRHSITWLTGELNLHEFIKVETHFETC